MSHIRDSAIQKLAKSIKTFFEQSACLEGTELDNYRDDGYTSGWKVEIRVAARVIPCAILLDRAFPFSSPRVAILDYERFSPKIPHVGHDGLLCLGVTGFDYFTGQDSIKHLIQAAYDLIETGLFRRNDVDFQNEFLNYWYWNLGETKSYACVKRINCLASIVYVAIHGEIYFFDNEQFGREWLKHRFGSLPKGTCFKNTIFLPVEKTWLPSQYPKNGHDIMEIIKKHATASWKMPLECAAIAGKPFIPIIFFFKFQNVFVATKIKQSQKNFHLKQYGKREIPWELLARHFFSPSAEVEKMFVQRIDSEWLHYRSKVDKAGQLRDMKVAILGCGSLGGQVADSLCRAGIGKITLFDPDILLWENIYRHILGPEYINCKKAKALASFLEKKFPETIISFYTVAWEKHFAEHHEQFQNFDLIISLIGDTENNTEHFLSYCSNKSFYPPVLFGWTEVWGAAGHALLLGSEDADGCLLCKNGEEHQTREVFSFAQEQTIKLPACNVTFAPYGFIDVAPIVSMISNLALDFLSDEEGVRDNYRIWVSHVNKITKHGGVLNQWVKEKFGCIQGEQVIRTRWVPDAQCPVCCKNDL